LPSKISITANLPAVTGDPGDILLSGEFNLPLRYDAKVDQEAKAEAAKFFAADLQK
jgi:hypothetical protein